MPSSDPNPYAAPLDQSPASAPGPDKRQPGHAFLWTVFWSILFSIAGGMALLVVGHSVGGWAFDWNPTYWFDAIYGWEYDERSSAKVRIQTQLRFAFNMGAFGFWTGLILPWVRYVWRRLDSPRCWPLKRPASSKKITQNQAVGAVGPVCRTGPGSE